MTVFDAKQIWAESTGDKKSMMFDVLNVTGNAQSSN